ncbi:MAG TPA: recombinase family protein [Gemmataceae bacterium]|jgi:site-specific DNA recombinase
MNKSKKTPAARPTVRCAIYTRKSTEEGLEQEFNTLDAQRECSESFIKSQAAEGWQCLPERYDDGGFSGGNMDRPALQHLLADIEAGKVDAVCVYKVDRLSRSLLDFARMMDVFDKHHVAFVSVTQQINSATSMGRLMLNVLLSFAQFEREIIGERTRDKIAAARRKGKWAGGHPILGYDIDRRGIKLIINEDEAAQVRAIFELYLEHEGLLAVIAELNRRGWVNKRWVTRKGQVRGGKPFTKTSLHKLLTNVTYVGKVRHKHEHHDGEHEALISAEVWQRAQVLLRRNGRNGGALVRNQFGALLKGILRCVPCDCAMTPAHTTRNGTKRYRYYVCTAAQKRGWHTCPSKSISAGEIEQFVVRQLRVIGHDPALRNETFAAACAQGHARIEELSSERHGLERSVERWHAEIHTLVAAGANNGSTPDITRLADLQERIRLAEQRTTEINEEIHALDGARVSEDEVASALSAFDPVWETLTPREQARIVQLLVQRVDYDGAEGQVSITFQPSGIKTLADELAQLHQGEIT